MKNLKFLSFALLFWVLVIAWCEKANNEEKMSCESDDVCPVETSSIEIEEAPSVIVEANDEGWILNWNWEWARDEEVFENNEQVVEEPMDQPMTRKMLVDENATAEEIEQGMVNTCANAGWIWSNWVCTLEDGSVIAF